MQISPRQLLLSQRFNNKFSRLDLIVRYILLEAYYGDGDIDYEFAKNLYLKMQKQRTGGTTHTNGSDYLSEFLKLAESFKHNGYIDSYPLIVNEEKHLINSSHRAACSLYFNIKKMPLQISKDWKKHLDNPNPKKQTYLNYGLDWFEQNQFSQHEIEVIEKKRKSIFSNLGIEFQITLWSPVEKYFLHILEDVSREHTVIKYDFYNLKGEYDNFVKKIYHIDDIEGWKVNKKLAHMNSSSNIMVIHIDLFNATFRKKTRNNNKYICVEMEQIKKKIRDKYRDKVDDYFYDIIIHIGDNFEHSEHMSKVLSEYSDKKIQLNHLQELFKTLKKLDIEKTDVCIVGSSRMALEGIRKNNDIDIVLRKEIRDKLFPGASTRLSENIEIVRENWLYSNDKISDDIIIDNNSHHDIFCGFKFVSLELLKHRKRNSLKQKDEDDIMLIEANESRN